MSHGVITVTETLREALDKDDYYISFTLTSDITWYSGHNKFNIVCTDFLAC